ncbi:hypothetical protein BC826DRAFT_968630 [Russula brevipes]|nr:hypothetical protein BC826DRAFT_968630 [Russula brevipes]
MVGGDETEQQGDGVLVHIGQDEALGAWPRCCRQRGVSGVDALTTQLTGIDDQTAACIADEISAESVKRESKRVETSGILHRGHVGENVGARHDGGSKFADKTATCGAKLREYPYPKPQCVCPPQDAIGLTACHLTEPTSVAEATGRVVVGGPASPFQTDPGDLCC